MEFFKILSLLWSELLKSALLSQVIVRTSQPVSVIMRHRWVFFVVNSVYCLAPCFVFVFLLQYIVAEGTSRHTIIAWYVSCVCPELWSLYFSLVILMQPCDIIILQVILLLIVQMKKIRFRAIKLCAQHQSIPYLVNHFLSKIIFFSMCSGLFKECY